VRTERRARANADAKAQDRPRSGSVICYDYIDDIVSTEEDEVSGTVERGELAVLSYILDPVSPRTVSVRYSLMLSIVPYTDHVSNNMHNNITLEYGQRRACARPDVPYSTNLRGTG